jgi:PEP-CTERM motif
MTAFWDRTRWGSNSGQFLEAGPVPGGSLTSRIDIIAPDGSRSVFVNRPGGDFGVPVIAPAGFGSYGGQLIVPNGGNGNILAFSPNGSSSALASVPGTPYNPAFAPTGFGNLDGRLFVDNANGGQIYSVAGSGSVSLFATIPLLPGQPGLRQMAFSPSGFLPGQGELLFVSVSGSISGGGTLGDIVALNSSGQIVYDLRKDLGLTKFDPRGLYFVDSQQLLVSDASDPIYSVSPPAFQAVPEPASLILLVLGLAGPIALGMRRMR